MAKSQDLFDDSTMSFGEHLEVLRVHLWKAIVGLVIAVILSLFIGNYVVDVVRGPIDRALERHGVTTQDDIGGFDFFDWLSGSLSGEGNRAAGAGITDQGLLHLEKLKKLKQLGLHSSAVTVEGLRRLKESHPKIEVGVDPLELAGLAHLRTQGARCQLNEDYEPVVLSLRGTEATDDDVKRLGQLTRLEHLDLQGLEIDDDALELLGPLTALESLNLSGTDVTDDGLDSLSHLSALKRLDLRQTDVTDRGLAKLRELTALEHLDLRDTKVTDAGLSHLGKLTRLQTLYLSGEKITDQGLVHLKDLKELKRLEFKETAVTDAGLEHLSSLVNLEVLNFTAGPAARDPFAENLSPELMDEGTINVRLRASRLAELLHQIDSEAYPSPSEEFEDRVVTLPIAAPEFREFKETAVNFRKPVTLNVQEAFLTYLKVAFIAGLLFSSPWVFYQLWLFVAAGLYPHERKYVYVYLPMSTMLFIGGALFCFFAVFPFVLKFLLGFNAWLGVTPQIRLSEWISFAIVLPLMFGIAFQLPLVMLFLERISIFDAEGYRQKRRMAVLVIAVLSMFLTPADPMSMLMMMFPLIGLYELGILLCTYSPVKSPFETEAA